MAEFYGGGARCSDNVRELEVLLYDGTIMRVGKTDDADLKQIVASAAVAGVGDPGLRGSDQLGAAGVTDPGYSRRVEIYRKLLNLRDKYGELIRERFPRIPRRVSGYNLDELLPENGFDVARALVGVEAGLDRLDAVVKDAIRRARVGERRGGGVLHATDHRVRSCRTGRAIHDVCGRLRGAVPRQRLGSGGKRQRGRRAQSQGRGRDTRRRRRAGGARRVDTEHSRHSRQERRHDGRAVARHLHRREPGGGVLRGWPRSSDRADHRR